MEKKVTCEYYLCMYISLVSVYVHKNKELGYTGRSNLSYHTLDSTK